jgi:hypothetical protein
LTSLLYTACAQKYFRVVDFKHRANCTQFNVEQLKAAGKRPAGVAAEEVVDADPAPEPLYSSSADGGHDQERLQAEFEAADLLDSKGNLKPFCDVACRHEEDPLAIRAIVLYAITTCGFRRGWPKLGPTAQNPEDFALLYGDQFSRVSEGMFLSGFRRVVVAVEYDACIDIVRKGPTATSRDLCFNDMTMRAGTERLKKAIVDRWNVSDRTPTLDDYPFIRIFKSKDHPSGIPLPDFPVEPVEPSPPPRPVAVAPGPTDGFGGAERFEDDTNAGANPVAITDKVLQSIF